MKKYNFFIIFLSVIILSSCKKDLLEREVTSTTDNVVMNTNHPMKASLQTIISKYIGKGLPGVQVAVKNKDGWFFTSGGYAKVESKSALSPNAPGWFFSITKIHTAALIMKQKEKGLINLDGKINQYLPASASSSIEGSNQITVRMLLNHSSGIVNFTELPAYQLAQFNNPMKQPSINDILEMVKGKDLLTTPGEEFNYCNTNYLLLTLILEKVTGKSYKQLWEEEIARPLGLTKSYYGVSDDQAVKLGFPNYYVDRHGNDQLENATGWNNALANACAGWGGLAGTPSDAIRFFEALMKGQVVSAASLNEMLTWYKGKSSEDPNYGLGIEYSQYANGTTPQRGHEGDGIGNSTLIFYVPDNDTYLFVNVTAGRQLAGPYLFKITDFKNELCKYVAEWR